MQYILAALGLLAVAVVIGLAADPEAKISLAKYLVREGRAQLAAREAARLAYAEASKFEGDLTHAIDEFCFGHDRAQTEAQPAHTANVHQRKGESATYGSYETQKDHSGGPQEGRFDDDGQGRRQGCAQGQNERQRRITPNARPAANKVHSLMLRARQLWDNPAGL